MFRIKSGDALRVRDDIAKLTLRDLFAAAVLHTELQESSSFQYLSTNFLDFDPKKPTGCRSLDYLAKQEKIGETEFIDISIGNIPAHIQEGLHLIFEGDIHDLLKQTSRYTMEKEIEEKKLETITKLSVNPRTPPIEGPRPSASFQEFLHAFQQEYVLTECFPQAAMIEVISIKALQQKLLEGPSDEKRPTPEQHQQNLEKLKILTFVGSVLHAMTCVSGRTKYRVKRKQSSGMRVYDLITEPTLDAEGKWNSSLYEFGISCKRIATLRSTRRQLLTQLQNMLDQGKYDWSGIVQDFKKASEDFDRVLGEKVEQNKKLEKLRPVLAICQGVRHLSTVIKAEEEKNETVNKLDEAEKTLIENSESTTCTTHYVSEEQVLKRFPLGLIFPQDKMGMLCFYPCTTPRDAKAFFISKSIFKDARFCEAVNFSPPLERERDVEKPFSEKETERMIQALVEMLCHGIDTKDNLFRLSNEDGARDKRLFELSRPSHYRGGTPKAMIINTALQLQVTGIPQDSTEKDHLVIFTLSCYMKIAYRFVTQHCGDKLDIFPEKPKHLSSPALGSTVGRRDSKRIMAARGDIADSARALNDMRKRNEKPKPKRQEESCLARAFRTVFG